LKNLFSLLLLSLCSSAALAQGVHYTLSDNSGGLGGTPYSVTTPVTFSNLSLTLVYADAFSQVDQIAGTVSPGQTKNSSVYALADPVHGAIQTATMQGLFSTLSWQTSPTFNGTKTAHTVSNPFSATVAGGTLKFAFVDGTDTSTAAAYHAGNLSSGPSTITTTPEPGPIALLVSLALVAPWFRRFRSRTSLRRS
jgi:hypothetical protein